MKVFGRKPEPTKRLPLRDEIAIECYKCHHEWVVKDDYGLLFWGWIDCPKCGETNEVGDQ